ncbi:MAG: LysR family transcriptional regulator, partial [Fluviicola sp.]
MISSQQIKNIDNLNQTKTISSAADKRFLTQPTLSIQIKKAEEVLV